MRHFKITVIIFLIPLAVHSQLRFNIYTLARIEDGPSSKNIPVMKLPSSVFDSMAGVKECSKQLLVLYEKGYLAASFDSVYIEQGKFNAGIYYGDQYKWAALNSSISKTTLNDAGIRLSLEQRKPVSASKISSIIKRLLKWYNNNGYPFAVVKLQHLVFDKGHLSGELIAEKGQEIGFDTLIIKGNSKLSPVYLSSYLGLKKNVLYNENRVNKISTRLRELPFINEIKPSELEFSESKARAIIYIDNKKASQFNGIIGVLPDNTEKGKVNITGDVRLRLLSAFGHAELFDVNWSNPLPKSQDLKVKLSYPFIFDTQLGLDADISIFKKDTTFLEFNRELAIQYFFIGNNYFKVFAGRKSSNLISVTGYANIITLPPFADVTVNTYGIGWKYEHVDYKLNPRRGFSIEFQAGAGNKVITRNSKINEQLYANLDLKTTNYNAKGNVDIYIPLSGRGVLNFGANGAILFSPVIFENELYRIGGLKTLRGFDELSINASQFMLGKMELRYILEQNSYLVLFTNSAYYENRSRTNFIHDTPIGFGAGMTFETNLGIFSFNYALGKQFNNPFLLRSGKIHFGLVNYF